VVSCLSRSSVVPIPTFSPRRADCKSRAASRDTGRLEAFSDGVFAIAITLLVLEISVPEAAFDHVWKGIGDQWPSYLGYATSFLTIGGLWLVHHGIFRRLASADSVVMQLNILLLLPSRWCRRRALGFYIVVTLLALLAPRVAAFGYLVIAVVGVFRLRCDRSRASRPA
jgi:Endosomal/lysosomal potassium channel TMEM175